MSYYPDKIDQKLFRTLNIGQNIQYVKCRYLNISSDYCRELENVHSLSGWRDTEVGAICTVNMSLSHCLTVVSVCHNHQSDFKFVNEESEVRVSLYTCHLGGGIKYIAAQYQHLLNKRIL